MPTMNQASVNPNDYQGLKGGAGYQKKQFGEMNQHYFSHNAVLPGQIDASGQSDSKTRNGGASPYVKDPYSNIPMKPNQMS